MGARNFTFDGDNWQVFKVTKNVTKVNIDCRGASGYATGAGGQVLGTVRVKDSDELWIQIGHRGHNASGANGGNPAFPNGGQGGNGGAGNRAGGHGGGGMSIIRLNGPNGDLVCVAGGGGGTSGDGGVGGHGGPGQGQHGSRPDGAGNQATGGDQNSGGQGGRTSAGANFYGGDAGNGKFDRAGKGGFAANNKAIGGGGGGGGYHSGGGGQAAKAGAGGASGGGGAGGSNFTGGLIDNDDLKSHRGVGTGDGFGYVGLTWQDFGDYPPSAPTSVKIGNKDLTDEVITRSMGSVTISGVPDDPTKNQDVRMIVMISLTSDFAGHLLEQGTWDEQNKRDFVTFNGLQKDSLYHVRAYSQDKRGQRSNSYKGGSFWTNRRPIVVNTIPEDDTDLESITNIPFQWTYDDLDSESGDQDKQTSYQLKYRKSPTPLVQPGPWIGMPIIASEGTRYDVPLSTFPGNTYYDWAVRAADKQDFWSEWSISTRIFVVAHATPPRLIDPIGDEAIFVDETNIFTWQYLTVNAGDLQVKADLRYRMIGSPTWTTITGDTVIPGANGYWVFLPETFTPGVHYEWQMRTFGSATVGASEWTLSATFWAANSPGGTAQIPDPTTRTQEALGSGHNRAYVYQRGGEVLVGEITPMVDIAWHRQRDDISRCVIHVNEWDAEGHAFLASLRTWAEEIVVFRDGVRVWEGPIVRIGNDKDTLEIEAHDVMAYVYRRVMRQGYNDSYQCTQQDVHGNCIGLQLGLHSVVYRATRIVINALVYDDPNVLPFLTPLNNPGDAILSRIVKDFSKTAWEEIDDLAATAGLDYVTVGRRILLWDTHRPIGRLPEMGDGDFAERPLITEYGMSAANVFAVTSGTGLYGMVSKVPAGGPGPEGYIEQLASAYGESEGDVQSSETLSAEEIAALIASLTEQANRNIAGRWPVPQIVRIPDNSALLPTVNLTIQQLIPGVWIPLRATGSIRAVAQWQKLDSVAVRESADEGEKITVILSPAPNEGEDPDSSAVEEE